MILVCCVVAAVFWMTHNENPSEPVAVSEVIPQEPDYADASQWYSTDRDQLRENMQQRTMSHWGQELL